MYIYCVDKETVDTKAKKKKFISHKADSHSYEFCRYNTTKTGSNSIVGLNEAQSLNISVGT